MEKLGIHFKFNHQWPVNLASKLDSEPVTIRKVDKLQKVGKKQLCNRALISHIKNCFVEFKNSVQIKYVCLITEN